MCPRIAAATINTMQTTVYEIADRVYRLSTCVPEVAPGGFTFNQYLLDGDEPLLFHTGPRRMFPLVSEAVGEGAPGRPAALDQLRPRRGRRVRRDERVAGRRAVGPGAVQRAGLHGVGRRPRRPPAGARHRRQRPRHRRPPHPHDRHPARPARLGGAGDLRRDDRHAALRRPVHPHRRRRRPRARRRPRRARARRRRPVRRHLPHPVDGPRAAGVWPTCRPVRWRSCTVRRSRATARVRCARSPTPTRRGSPPRSRSDDHHGGDRPDHASRGAGPRRGRDGRDGRAAGRPLPRGVGAADRLPGLGRPGDGRARAGDGRGLHGPAADGRDVPRGRQARGRRPD